MWPKQDRCNSFITTVSSISILANTIFIFGVGEIKKLEVSECVGVGLKVKRVAVLCERL